MDRAQPMPFGGVFRATRAACYPLLDLMNHHGQILYLQSLLGDAEMHWPEEAIAAEFAAPRTTMMIFDSHLDLAMNALDWNRDLRKTVLELTRRRGRDDREGPRGGTVAFPELRAGDVAIATLMRPPKSRKATSVRVRLPRWPTLSRWGTSPTTGRWKRGMLPDH